MRLEKWFISNLDDSQRQIIVRDPNENLIVQGAAGSGKTNLAIHRAVQASTFSNSYSLVVYTVALKRMVAYGLEALGLDRERVSYDWAWANRGFDLIGDVYCRCVKKTNGHYQFYLLEDNAEYGYRFDYKEAGDWKAKIDGKDLSYSRDPDGIPSSRIQQDPLIKEQGVYTVINKFGKKITGKLYYRIEIINSEIYLFQNNKLNRYDKVKGNYEQAKSSNPYKTTYKTIYGIDFGDYVDKDFYSAFGRRKSWFVESSQPTSKHISDNDMVLIPGGTMFKKVEEKLDYLIIDEAQDFNVSDYKERFIPQVNKSLSLFGDSAQRIYTNRGASIDTIAAALRYKRFFLKYNYRIPKAIAKVAQDIAQPSIDLLTDNMKNGGNSDHPHYPKPVVQKCQNREDEMDAIVKRIKLENLDDVAILVPSEEDVKYVNEYLNKYGIQTQVHYRTGHEIPFHTINTLDFTNNDLPCILTYHAAKGTEFDNVFIPFANNGEVGDRNAFYVACTRSSHSLTISFSKQKLTSYLSKIDRSFIVQRNVPANAWIEY